MYKGIFVTGTDTGVGKTYVACAVAQALKERGISVGVMKPIATGDREDAKKLIEAAGLEERLETVTPVFLKYPLAPLISARLSGKKIALGPIRTGFRKIMKEHDFTVVEGIGGLLVPITKKYYLLDLMTELKLPVLVVARPYLGTINHTLLTIDKLRERKLAVAGVVLSNYQSATLAEKTNPESIRELTGLPVLELPCREAINLEQNPWIAGIR